MQIMFHVKHYMKVRMKILSKYTTQVRWIIEQATSDNKNLPISQRVNLACPIIFNFDFPIWVEEYRLTLEKKILMHYFNKEIGFETVGLWKFYLEERLSLIMPYYNELYKTTVKDYDWLSDTNAHETYVGNKKLQETAKFDANGNVKNDLTEKVQDTGGETFNGIGTNTLDATQTQNTKTLESDLPQANYANLDYGTKLTDSEQSKTSHEDSTTKNESTTDRNITTDTTQNSNTATTQNSTNDLQSNTDDIFTRDRIGAFGNHSLTELLMQYRGSLINIDNMVIDELKDLFMMIY